MERIPARNMSSKTVYTLTSEIKSVLDCKHDKWTVSKAFERVRFDLNILTKLSKLIMALFKEEDGDEASSSRFSRKSVAIFATMMRKAFKDDDFISSKLSMQHMFISCLILKAYDYCIWC